MSKKEKNNEIVSPIKKEVKRPLMKAISMIAIPLAITIFLALITIYLGYVAEVSEYANATTEEWEEYRKQQEIKRRERLNELRKIKAEQKSHISPTQTSGNQNSLPQNRLQNEYIESDRSCFNCVSNLSWKNRDGLANCGCYMSLGIPKRNNPEYAINCQNFREKQKP